jgi:resuscitation-promoting factor RpfB
MRFRRRALSVCLMLVAVTSTLVAPQAEAHKKGKHCTKGYKPCLHPASDYDCAGGSGDGPKYVSGTVKVNGSDPYGLDSDNDGVGCE